MTFSGPPRPAPTHTVDDGVDKVCRHAGHVVRSLGKELWKRLTRHQDYFCEQGKRDPPAVWKKNFAGIFCSVIHSSFPQAWVVNLWITGLPEARPQAPPT